MEHNFDSWNETVSVKEDCKSFRESKNYPGNYKTIVKMLFNAPGKVFSATYFQLEFAINKRDVRQCVRHARLIGHPICANGFGYFYNTNPEILIEHSLKLEGKAKDMLQTAAREKRAAAKMGTRKMWQKVKVDQNGQTELVM